MASSKFRNYFIGNILSRNDNVFTQAKIEVLFNFTLLFLFTNIPYCILALSLQTIHKVLAVTTVLGLIAVLVALKNFKNLKLGVWIYILNHAFQNLTHFLINNGRLEEQGVLFFILFISFGFFLAGRTTGFLLSAIVIITFIIGTYNNHTGHSLFEFPPEMADPMQTPEMKYFTLIPIFMIIYLISQFIKTRQKAEKQIEEQRRLLEEKNKEVMDSIHYAKRIQNSIITSEKYIAREINKLKK
jgi:hypothetical protein